MTVICASGLYLILLHSAFAPTTEFLSPLGAAVHPWPVVSISCAAPAVRPPEHRMRAPPGTGGPQAHPSVRPHLSPTAGVPRMPRGWIRESRAAGAPGVRMQSEQLPPSRGLPRLPLASTAPHPSHHGCSWSPGPHQHLA